MQIKLGTWVAGRKDAPQGTIDWAGGVTDFSTAPFDGYYQSLRIQDYMGSKGAKEATEYHYTDRSGSWQSIKVVNNGQEADDDVTSSSTSAKPTTTKKPTSSSAATTLATVSSSASHSSSNGTTAETTPTPTPTGGNDEEANATTSASETASTAAAPTMVGNMAAVGAAALFGYLVL